MTTITDPVIGHWYKDAENSLTFKVVAIDDNDDSIEVQYSNGDLGEYDNEAWYGSTIYYIEAPQDWSAPFDDLETDDLDYGDDELNIRSNSKDLDINDLMDE